MYPPCKYPYWIVLLSVELYSDMIQGHVVIESYQSVSKLLIEGLFFSVTVSIIIRHQWSLMAHKFHWVCAKFHFDSLQKWWCDSNCFCFVFLLLFLGLWDTGESMWLNMSYLYIFRLLEMEQIIIILHISIINSRTRGLWSTETIVLSTNWCFSRLF